MFLRLLVLVAISLLSKKTVCQEQIDQSKRMAVVHGMIDSYNQHNYRAMKKPWVGIAKLFLSKKKFEAEFSPTFQRFGEATIDTVTYSSKYEYVAKLKMEKSATTPLYYSFIFSERGKLQGFGQTYPPLIYKKRISSTPINSVSFSQRLDSLLEKKYLHGKTKSFNGNIMVLDQGKVIYKKNCGYLDFETKQPLNDSSLFDLASVSKQFTALAILMLEAEGKLTLQDDIRKFIPNLPYSGINLEQLLTHTSGLPEYMEPMKKYWDKKKFATNYDVIQILSEHNIKANFQPGEHFQYCNTGYVMLSIVIEKASGLTYSQFLQEHIFVPLGMKHTRIYNTRRTEKEKLANCTNGYVFSETLNMYEQPDTTTEYGHVTYLDPITGDGNISSCLNDLAIWEKELLRPTSLNSSMLQKMYVDHKTYDGNWIHYGYGFFLNGGKDSEPLIHHTGGWPGYFCILMNFFDEQKQIVVLSNNSYDSFTRIADDIANMILEN